MKELEYWIWLSLACTPGAETFGKLISRFSSPVEIYNADKEEIRPYRFCGKFKNGKNEINVRLSIQYDMKPEIKSALLGKVVNPSVKHPLFNGMMRVIVKPSDNCVLTAKSDNGYNTKIKI